MERFVYMYRSTFLKYGSSLSDERTVYVVLSNMGIYILKRDSQTNVYSTIATHKLKDIKRIVIGLFYQLFRLEMTDESTNYVFTTRSHERVHNFLDILVDTIREDEEKFQLERCHRSRETFANINSLLSKRDPAEVHLYVMLHYKLKTSKGFVLVPRSLIITQEKLHLCEEDYSKWPSLGVPNAKTPSTPQFQIIQSKNISEVMGLQVDDKKPCELSILFEDEQDKGKVREWSFVTSHKSEQQRIIKILSALWKALFQVDIGFK